MPDMNITCVGSLQEEKHKKAGGVDAYQVQKSKMLNKIMMQYFANWFH